MKTNYLKHHNYLGSVECDIENRIMYGKLLFIDDIVTYEGKDIDQLVSSFKSAVDDYIVTCKELNREPHKTHSGSLNIRIGEQLHRDAAILAFKSDKKLNEFIKDAISEKINNQDSNDLDLAVGAIVEQIYTSEKAISSQIGVIHKESNIFTQIGDAPLNANQQETVN